MRTVGRALGRMGVAVAVALAATPAVAAPQSVWERAMDAALQCVPFAREVSGVGLYGDAHTWWAQAAGRYERGHAPRVGAVMAFTPHGGMKLGHVAVVRRLVNAREVRLDHSNWSPIGGRRGQIERDVRAVDVSDAGDWSRVRVWFGPIAALGGTAWPVAGFIYPVGGDPKARIASSEAAERRVRARVPGRDAASPSDGPVRVATATPPARSQALGRLLAWRAGAAVAERASQVTVAPAREERTVRRAPRVVPAVQLATIIQPVGRNRAGVSRLSAPANRTVSTSQPPPAQRTTENGPDDLLALVSPARR